MFTHHSIEHLRAVFFALMVCGPALFALVAYLAPRLFPVSVAAMAAREEQEAIVTARRMFAEADMIDREVRAVSAYLARFSSVPRLPAASPRSVALRAAAWALVGTIVTSGVIDTMGSL